MRTVPLLAAVAFWALQASAGGPPLYVGAGSCAARNCHGSVTARTESKLSSQNEYITWYKEDRHAKAYGVLLEERSFAIARRLGMVPPDADPTTWLFRTAHPEKCLDCHTLNPPRDTWGPRFDGQQGISREGVSCEACHGPAGGWIARHTEAGWTPEKSVALGMFDTSDSAATAQVCLSCHLGSPTKRVDHDMLAAGHPALAFELDTFASCMPAHWVEHAGNAGWYRGQPWLLGQAVTLAAAARHLERQLGGTGWPDFSAYDCESCHHELRPESQWRQDRGDGAPGRPPWEEGRYAILSRVVRVVAPDLVGALDGAVRRLDALAREGHAGPELPASAEVVAAMAGRVVERVRGTELDAERIDRLVSAILADGGRLGYGGFRAAQQVAWGLDSLAAARQGLAAPMAPDDRTRCDEPGAGPVGRLFQDLADPGDYDPARFARDVAGAASGAP